MTNELGAPSERAKAAKLEVAKRGGTLHGLPAKRVRDALRACEYGWDDAEIVRLFEGAVDPAALRASLAVDGFIDAEGKLLPDGFSLMNAKAQKRIPRARADKALAELLDRVRYVNTESHFAFAARRVIVFGSYISDAPDLGDLDVMVEYEQRLEDKDEQRKLEDARRKAALAEGRNLSDFMKHLFWPNHEVQLFLKARDRVLSFADASVHEEWIKERPHKVVYEFDRAARPPTALKSSDITAG